MSGYTPEQMPELSTLARGFATFDHWFAEVPSQTFVNRSFFHAANSSGFVVNAPYANFPLYNSAETLFERLQSKGLSWRVYVGPPSRIPFTGLIHGPRLRDRFATNFLTTDRFFEDAENGALPTYSFIEPNMWHSHNDMHPPISALFPGFAFDVPSSLVGGEALVARIYDAVRSSSSSKGSNCFNTLLMIVCDEHGGTYDHVPPPMATPPDPAAPAGQMGFRFDRLGVRLPAVAISPWIAERTVVNDPYRHTSLIRTMRERWALGRPLTARDADAPDITPVLSRDQPRAPEEGRCRPAAGARVRRGSRAARRAALRSREGHFSRISGAGEGPRPARAGGRSGRRSQRRRGVGYSARDGRGPVPGPLPRPARNRESVSWFIPRAGYRSRVRSHDQTTSPNCEFIGRKGPRTPGGCDI
jgi:phospholipase C